MGQDAFLTLLLTFPIFLFSLSVHEAAHALTAAYGGDMTSAYQNRITLNPLPHIDPVGTIMIPVLAALFGGLPLIGWAKPVPVVEQNFRRGSNYGVIVAMAGPFSNLLIALFTVAVAQIWYLLLATTDGFGGAIPQNAVNMVGQFITYMILINLVLMAFNMIPIPPLDGSHLLWHWFVKSRPKYAEIFFTVRQYSYIILIGLLMFGVISFIFTLVVFPIFNVLRDLIYWPLDLLN